jgi:cytoskeleton protein RodZ
MLAQARSTRDSADAAVATPAATPSLSEQGLRLTFSEECWFEVRDANGARLATGTARAGTSRLVTGARPFAVTVGVADAVTLSLDGEPLQITAADRRGRAARLTVR